MQLEHVNQSNVPSKFGVDGHWMETLAASETQPYSNGRISRLVAQLYHFSAKSPLLIEWPLPWLEALAESVGIKLRPGPKAGAKLAKLNCWVFPAQPRKAGEL